MKPVIGTEKRKLKLHTGNNGGRRKGSKHQAKEFPSPCNSADHHTEASFFLVKAKSNENSPPISDSWKKKQTILRAAVS